MKKLSILLLLALCVTAVRAQDDANAAKRNRYALAERFTASKLGNMLFSTMVDPHWFKSGEKFWYSYKTSEGTRWYVVDPDKRQRKPLFDLA